MRDINWPVVLGIAFAVLIVAVGVFFILDNVLGTKVAEFKTEITDTQIVITHHTSKDSDGHTTTRTDTDYYFWFDDEEFGHHRVEVGMFTYYKAHRGETHSFSMKRGKFTKLEYFSFVK